MGRHCPIEDLVLDEYVMMTLRWSALTSAEAAKLSNENTIARFRANTAAPRAEPAPAAADIDEIYTMHKMARILRLLNIPRPFLLPPKENFETFLKKHYLLARRHILRLYSIRHNG